MLLPTATVLLAGLAAVPPATAPRSLSSGELHRAIERLDVAGSVLYVAAHPDDENTRLLAWLVGAKGLRTTYVSLTRGDGGQNLVGDERGDLLGVLRTRELLAARRIDGAEQRSPARSTSATRRPRYCQVLWMDGSPSGGQLHV